jgi:hypothetical protein
MSLEDFAGMSLRVWKWVEVATGLCGAVLAISSTFLWMHYAYTRPTTRNSRAGRIYALNTHGWIVYLNGREQTLLYLLMTVGGALFVSAVVIDLVRKPFRPK